MWLLTLLGVLQALINQNQVVGVSATNGNKTFECVESGKFPAPENPPCKFYYCCDPLRPGNFNKTLQECKLGLFNPETRYCDHEYKCPYSSQEIAATKKQSIIECDASNDAVFECSGRGRYKDPSDFTCKNYYYCYRLRNGTFVQALYTCSIGRFNQRTQSCDLRYRCPCTDKTVNGTSTETTHSDGTTSKSTENLTTESISISTTSNVDTTTKKRETTTTDLISDLTTNGQGSSYKSTESSNTDASSTTNIPSTESTSTDLIPCNADETFSCSKEGKFQNPTDFTCKTFYECAELTCGNLTQILYTCSDGVFNPNSQKCESNYECHCSEETTTQPDVTTSGQSTTSKSTENSSTDLNSTTNSPSTESTSTDLIPCNADETFSCSKEGKFQNPTDFTCKTFYECAELTCGNLTQILYTCSDGVFNPNSQKCESNYECHCSEETTTQPDVTTSGQRTTSKSTKNSSTDLNSTTNSPSTESTSTDLIPCNADELFSCSKEGKFQNPTDFTCKTFYECAELTCGNLTQILYTCSDGVFNPNSQKCESNYECHCSEETTTQPDVTTSGQSTTSKSTENSSTDLNSTTNSPSTESTSTDLIPCNADETFSCSKEGKFQNPTDFTCKTFYQCAELTCGNLTQILYTCSVGVFNPNSQKCESNYECHCSEETTTQPDVTTSGQSTTSKSTENSSTDLNSTTNSPSTESTSTDLIPCNADETFSCSKEGKFQNPTDFTCKTFYECAELTCGNLTQILYTCSDGVFNPNSQKCESNYECHCSEETNTQPDVTTSGQSPTSKSTENTTTNSPSTESTSTDLIPCNADETFSCSKEGKFQNPTDFTCKTFYECAELTCGNLTQILYTCSDGVFNPNSQKCESNYECHCSEETTTQPDVTTSGQSTTSKSTENSSTDLNSTTNSPSTESTSTDLIPCNADETFSCSKEGKFQNPTDFTCKTFYECAELTCGNLTQILYTCSDGVFNPNSQKCESNYECHCSEETTTQPDVTTSGQSTTSKSTENSSTDLNSTTNSPSTESTSTDLIPCNADATFSCSKEGKFQNPTDFTCKTFYQCAELTCGNLTQILYTCSDGVFNPNSQKCESNYECHCSEETTTQPDVTTSGQSTTSKSTENSSTDLNSTTNSPSTESTSTDLIPCNADETFSCSKEGKFQNPNDFTCKTFYECAELTCGNLTQILYTCSDGVFNPNSQKCESNYECHCSEETTTQPDVTTSGQSTTSKSTENSSTDLNSTTNSPSTESTSTDLIPCNADATFSCSKEGKFQNPTDFTCKTFYQCAELTCGNLTQILYTCSDGVFNPNSQKCESNYECHCSEETTTQPDVTTSGQSTTSKSTENSSTDLNSTTNSPSTESTSTDLIPCNADETFSCSKEGKFQNPTDFTCKTFYECAELTCGNLTQILYTCSDGVFNPNSQKCESNYECHCSEETSTQPDVTTSGQRTTSKSTENSSTDLNSTTNSPSTESTSTDLIPCNADELFSCSKEGKFLNPTDFTCKTFYECAELTCGNLTQILYTCSDGVFNPNSQKCESNYECHCSEETTTQPDVTTSGQSTTSKSTENSSTDLNSTTNSPSTESTSTDLIPCNTDELFSCSKEGKFQNPTDFTCKTFYECAELTCGNLTQILYTCSDGVFNPNSQKCESNYECHCSEETTTQPDVTTSGHSTTSKSTENSRTDLNSTTNSPSTESTSTDLIPCNADETFSCPKEGKFQNPTDFTCKTFYHCAELTCGNLTQILYTCSDGVFDPKSQKCESNYECHCSDETTTQPDVTTKTEMSSPVTTTDLTWTTQTISTTSSDCDYSNQTFSCSKNGRFKDQKDLTCTSYILCHKPEGKEDFIQKRYTCCPGYFDPEIQGCVENYVCPCNGF